MFSEIPVRLSSGYPDVDQMTEGTACGGQSALPAPSCHKKDRLCDSPKASRKSGQLCVEACNKTRYKINASKLIAKPEFWDKEDRGAESNSRSAASHAPRE